MRHASFLHLALIVVGFGVVAMPTPARGQEPVPAIGQEQLTSYVRAYSAIAQLRDRIQHALAEPKNKKDEGQLELREQLREQIAKILKDHKLTEAQYAHVTYVISVDPERRKAFEELLVTESARKAPR